MPLDRIEIRGARQHNLKDVNLILPRDRLVVITGLSGSGKSSLAFDTIYAEGQRRYVESLSSYARQFLGQMDKPDVEYISGLSPAISIDQQTSEQIIDSVLDMPQGSRIMVLAPLVEGRKGEYQSVFDDVRKAGFVRVRVDGEVRDLSDSIEQALKLGSGQVIITEPRQDGGWADTLYSENFACPYDGTSLPALEPRSFSFNTPFGACPTCTGLGTRLEVDPDLVIP